MQDPIQDKIEELMLEGVLEVAGIDIDTGEPLYNFTSKLKEYDQDLYHIHNNYFFQDLTKLWEKGFVDIDFLQDDPVVTMTEKAWDNKEISKLNKEEKHSIDEIKRIIGDK